MKPIKILIVDDDEAIVFLLSESFLEEGWHCYSARDGSQALKKVESDSFNLIVLDLIMPGIDGLEVCRRLREWSKVPIIVLSAIGDIEDKVRCLNLGADDYVTKPFVINELVARIRAILRRNIIDNPKHSVFSCGNIKVDFVKRSVYVSDSEINLTPTEYSLLLELVTNIGKTVTYAHLLGKIWGPEFQEEREYLHVYIGHLRDKLETDHQKSKHIVNIPRVGYRFQI